MTVWIDEYGDIVWNDTGTFYSRNTWTDYLIDGCRLQDLEMNVGTWMILE